MGEDRDVKNRRMLDAALQRAGRPPHFGTPLRNPDPLFPGGPSVPRPAWEGLQDIPLDEIMDAPMEEWGASQDAERVRAERAFDRRLTPFGLGPITEPFVNTTLEPERRESVARNFDGAVDWLGGVGEGIGGYLGSGRAGQDATRIAQATPGALAELPATVSSVARQAPGALGRIGAAIGQGYDWVSDQADPELFEEPSFIGGVGSLAVEHGPDLLRALSYGPFENERRLQGDIDLQEARRARGLPVDEDALNSTADSANIETAFAGLNAAFAPLDIPAAIGGVRAVAGLAPRTAARARPAAALEGELAARDGELAVWNPEDLQPRFGTPPVEFGQEYIPRTGQIRPARQIDYDALADPRQSFAARRRNDPLAAIGLTALGAGGVALAAGEADAQEAAIEPIPDDYDVQQGTWVEPWQPLTLPDGSEGLQRTQIGQDGRAHVIIGRTRRDGIDYLGMLPVSPPITEPSPPIGDGAVGPGVTEARLPPSIAQPERDIPDWLRATADVGVGLLGRSAARGMGLRGLPLDGMTFGPALAADMALTDGEDHLASVVLAAAPVALGRFGDAVGPLAGRAAGELMRDGQLMVSPTFRAERDAFAQTLSGSPAARRIGVQVEPDPLDHYGYGAVETGGGIVRAVPGHEVAEQGYARTLGPAEAEGMSPREQFLAAGRDEQFRMMQRGARGDWANRGPTEPGTFGFPEALADVPLIGRQVQRLEAAPWDDVTRSWEGYEPTAIDPDRVARGVEARRVVRGDALDDALDAPLTFPTGFFDPATGAPLFGKPQRPRKPIDDLRNPATRIGRTVDTRIDAARSLGVVQEAEQVTGKEAVRRIMERASSDPAFMENLRRLYPALAALMVGGGAVGADMLDEVTF